VPLLAKVKAYARELNLLVQNMHLRGEVHNPENADLAKELCDICDRHDFLRLPTADHVAVPIRLNITGELVSEGPLSHEIVKTILASRCEWFTLLTEMAGDLQRTGRQSHLFASFSIGDCVPLSPFHKAQLRITKLDVLKYIQSSITPADNMKDAYTLPKDAIAIVGAECRLPGANGLEELWKFISTGVSTAKEVPPDRFDLYGSFCASQDAKWAAKQKFYGNFIEDAEGFDNAFFRMSPREAVNMDPQQRILLETAFQAMDSSGYLRSHIREKGDPVGCFIRASFDEYLDNTAANAPTAFTSTGTIRAFLSGKISYYFGWTGPSEVIDTTCSSSLVAINRACRAIQAGECPLALAGGVNIMSGI
jgi:hypothetical protein